MGKTRKIIKRICILAKPGQYGIQKEVNIIKEGNDLFYHFGLWKGTDHTNCLDEFRLSEKELKIFLQEAEKQLLRETELDKFQKDYIQQSHNGYVEIIKEKDL